MDHADAVRRALASIAFVVGVAVPASPTPGADDGLREVGILVPLTPASEGLLKSCGLGQEPVTQIVKDELQKQGYRVIPLEQKPRGGEVRVRITVVERKDGLDAWSVRLELRERGRLERDPSRLVAALSWDGPDSLTIGRSTGVCRDVEKNLRSAVQRLAEDRRGESAPTP